MPFANPQKREPIYQNREAPNRLVRPMLPANFEKEGPIPATEIMRTIKPLTGPDKMGTEDFIKMLKKAKSDVMNPMLH